MASDFICRAKLSINYKSNNINQWSVECRANGMISYHYLNQRREYIMTQQTFGSMIATLSFLKISGIILNAKQSWISKEGQPLAKGVVYPFILLPKMNYGKNVIPLGQHKVFLSIRALFGDNRGCVFRCVRLRLHTLFIFWRVRKWKES